MKILFLLGLIFSLLTAGCCGAMTPDTSSGYCPYGTYGSACSNVCSLVSGVNDCVSTCLDDVKSEGLGDATTCCTSTFRQECDAMCVQLEQSTQGDTTKAECMEECLGTHTYVGLNLDSCAIPV